ncbi:MAG: hypothetical protein GWN01_06970, partial [Nitrosopumilaceae archaeon]|nr:hypothetical protein [Nitrosopumilaceae archaeon]NIU87052.1 hypothetical protein [Nitrosopumilaceae archaeon]NIV65624.1 hypothetical protein [Nitrosopumilaceae archaeon]NIX61275.1 hypothetical protein [Nitrosopumilaceae archaeon]
MQSKKYKDYLKLNKSVLLAFAVSFSFAALAAELLSEEESYLNATLTLLVDYAAYFSTFGGLYYLDNRKKYRLSSGETYKGRLRHDLIKIISSLGIAEVVYTIVRWVVQYYLLTLNYEPYIASVMAQGISAVVYMVVINL